MWGPQDKKYIPAVWEARGSPAPGRCAFGCIMYSVVHGNLEGELRSSSPRHTRQIDNSQPSPAQPLELTPHDHYLRPQFHGTPSRRTNTPFVAAARLLESRPILRLLDWSPRHTAPGCAALPSGILLLSHESESRFSFSPRASFHPGHISPTPLSTSQAAVLTHAPVERAMAEA
jgi:hypothetical protein